MICCKILTDYKQNNMGELFEYLSDIGNWIFIDNILYFKSLDNSINKEILDETLKIKNYNDFLIIEIDKERINNDKSVIQFWEREFFTQRDVLILEKEKQEELKNIHEKIKATEFILDELIKKNKEGEN